MKLKKDPNLVTGTVAEQLLELSDKTMDKINQLYEDVKNAARCKFEYEKKRSNVLWKYKDAGKSQELREAASFHEYETEYKAYVESAALKEASVEAIKTYRQLLSSLQTYLNNERSEREFTKYGDPTP